jgi:hypothetical protein
MPAFVANMVMGVLPIVANMVIGVLPTLNIFVKVLKVFVSNCILVSFVML